MAFPLLAAAAIAGGAAIGGAIAKGMAGKVRRRPQLILPQDSAFREQLRLQAGGAGPSAVNAQAQASTERAQQQAFSLAAAARGPSIGLAQRNAQLAAAGASQGIAADAMGARIQEMQAARQEYAGYLWNENNARMGLESERQRFAEAEAARRAAMWGGILNGVGTGAMAAFSGGAGGAAGAAGSAQPLLANYRRAG